MKKTLRQLQTFMFFSMIGITVVLVVLFETDVLPSGLMATEKQTEFLLTTLMELLTLTCVYMALRLFKFDKEESGRVRPPKADGFVRRGLIPSGHLAAAHAAQYGSILSVYEYHIRLYGHHSGHLSAVCLSQ